MYIFLVSRIFNITIGKLRRGGAKKRKRIIIGKVRNN